MSKTSLHSNKRKTRRT